MSGRQLEVSVLVKVIDKLTAPLRQMMGTFDKLGSIARKIGALGAIAAGISFAVPLQQAAAFDQKIRDMVVTSGDWGRTAEASIRRIGTEMEQLALKVGITSAALTDARSVLIAAGMADDEVGRNMPTVGRVAKAASAEVTDVAKTVFALSNNLKIGADQMELSLAQLVTAGKLGRFEFKDMAKELPELTAQMSKLGITGKEAVATLGAGLQIAMFGTDSASTAANNFKNFLTKILAPDARKNFKEVGVDIAGVMADATAKGINPLEAALQKIEQATKVSDKEVDAIFKKAKGAGKTDAQAVDEVKGRIKQVLAGSKLGDLFADMQVLDFLTPMLLNKAKYREFKEAIASSGLDVIAKDFDTEFAGLSTQLLLFGEVGTQSMRRVGLAFARNLPWMNEQMMQLLRWVKKTDAAYPGLIDRVLTWGGAILVAIAALAILGPVLSAIGTAFGVLGAIISALLSPIGIVVAVLVGAALIIWRHWDQFKDHIAQVWEGVKTIFSGAVQAISALFAGDWSGVTRGLARIWEGIKTFGAGLGATLSQLVVIVNQWIKDTFGIDIGAIVAGWVHAAFGDDLTATAQRWMGAITRAVDDAWTTVKTSFDAVKGWVKEKIDAAVAVAEGAWSGMFDAANAVFERIKGAWKSAVDWISGMMPTFSLPSWLGGGSAPASGGAPQPGNDNTPATAPAPALPEKHAALPSARQVASRSEVGGRIVVSAVGGAKVERVQSDNPTVPLTTDRGAVVGRA